ncbi:MAG: hypothetical protein ABII71_03175 [Candidatus Micrarchaeota archaeon]
MKRIAFGLLLFACISFADAMPGPPPPQLEIIFMDGGADAIGSFEAKYVCEADREDDYEGIMEERERELPCLKNRCTNEYWFYKLNPCFYEADGHISYSRDGGAQMESRSFFMTEGGAEIRVDAASGEIEYTEKTPCCFSVLFLVLLALGAFKSGAKWN